MVAETGKRVRDRIAYWKQDFRDINVSLVQAVYVYL